jgi:uncharacterized protein YcnI
VPNERDNASTTKLEVSFPTDHPLASAMPEPMPGWKIEVTKSKLDKPIEMHGEKISEAVSKITWTAASGAGIKPGEFQEFDVSMGPLPKADQMIFKALQTYSDGTVVRWIEEPAADGAELESPAPVLKLVAATAEGAAPAATGAPAAAPGETESNGPDALSIAGLVAGVLALIIGLLAYAKAGRRPEPAAGAPAKSEEPATRS